jgi:hypothetical protein
VKLLLRSYPTYPPRVQCAYNPVVGREALWGANAFSRTYAPKRLLVIGAGPAGLEFARVVSGQGNAVVVYEREQAVGGHVRAYGALPYRQQFGSIATWPAEQARGNGSEIKLTSPVTRENICLRKAGSCCRRVRSALPARWLSRTNWKAIAGWETGKCVSSDEVALDKVSLTSGEALVIDEMADVAAPLTAVKLAKQGVRTRLFDKMANDRNGNGSRGVFPLDYDVCARSKSRGPYVAYC